MSDFGNYYGSFQAAKEWDEKGDLLRAEAVSVSNHPKIPSVEVRVTNQEGRLICHVTGMGYRKSMPLPISHKEA